jgi:GTP-binding protein Era
MPDAPFRSGFATLIGRPNVGKSTLLNAILGEKVSIVSDKAQTTRMPVRGVLNRPGVQLVFVDTPGIHKPVSALGERLNQHAKVSIGDVDVVCFVVDAGKPFGRGDLYVADRLSRDSICVINKIDAVPKGTVLKQLQKAGELDLSFLVEPIDGDGLVSQRLCSDPFVALLPPDSPILPASGPVRVEDLLRMPLIGQTANSCQLLIEEGLKQRGKPQITFRTNDNSAVQAMVRAGVGHAVLPRLAVAFDDPGVVIRDLEPPLSPRVLVLTRVVGRQLPSAVDEFAELARQWCAQHDQSECHA